jgi:hypothetical protein
MNTTNWDKALTYVVNFREFRDEGVGKDRAHEMILALTKAGGTFALSNGKLHLSDYSKTVFTQTYTDWLTADQPTKGTP